MTFLIIFFISFIATVFLTPYLIRYLESSGVIDRPSERKVHKENKPRMGGIVIFVVVFTLTLTFYENISESRFFLLGLIVISICGTIDDIKGIKWNTKFFLQAISVILLMIYLFSSFDNITVLGYQIPLYISVPLIFIFLIGTINSINLMDGLDGLVSGYSLVTSAVLFLLAVYIKDYFSSIVLVSILGSLVGYLKFNAFPARIFLGDFGSLMLGYLLVSFSVIISADYSKPNLELAFPILLLSVPILDTLKVFVRRILQKRHPFLPDNEHLHHVIFTNRVRHKTTVFLILLYNLGFITIALYFLILNSELALYAYLPMVLGLIFAKPIFNYFAKFDKPKSFISGLSSTPAKIFTIAKDVIVPVTVFFVVLIIFFSFPVKTNLTSYNIFMLIIMGIFIAALAVFHNKRTHKNVLNIYFFFNVSIYFILVIQLQSILNINHLFYSGFSGYTLLTGLVIIFLFVILFVIGREKILPNEKLFLTGIDLTMAIFVIGSFIIEKMFPRLISFDFAEAVFLAYVFYIWFKVVQKFKEKLAYYIFITSFILPLLALIMMFVYNGN